jgi:ribosomal protein S18 acetylase RimI-like enzyme
LPGSKPRGSDGTEHRFRRSETATAPFGENPPVKLSMRRIGPEEFQLVWPIFHEIVSAGETYAWDPETGFEAARELWCPPTGRCFVAETAGEVVGTYLLKPNQPGLGDHVANAGYMVAPAARGRGIASEMCEHSLAVARAAGFTAMQFNFVVASNEGAIRLWQRHGFAIVGRVPGAFRHARLGPTDVLVMHRGL